MIRNIDQFDLHERLYKGKASRVFSASDLKAADSPVVLKVYRKPLLSEVNSHQVSYAGI